MPEARIPPIVGKSSGNGPAFGCSACTISDGYRPETEAAKMSAIPPPCALRDGNPGIPSAVRQEARLRCACVAQVLTRRGLRRWSNGAPPRLRDVPRRATGNRQDYGCDGCDQVL